MSSTETTTRIESAQIPPMLFAETFLDKTATPLDKCTETVRIFFRQTEYQDILAELPIQYQILLFGDIEKDASQIRNLLPFIPLHLDKEETEKIITKCVEGVLQQIVAEAGPLTRVMLEQKFRNEETAREVLRKHLVRGVYRNHIRNRVKLATLEGTIECTAPDRKFRRERAAMYQEFTYSMPPIIDDCEFSEEDEYEEEIDQATEGFAPEITDPHVYTPQITSFAKLLEAAQEISERKDLNRTEKSRLLVEKLIEGGDDIDNDTINDMINSALITSSDFVRDLSKNLVEARRVIAEYSKLKLPGRRRITIDPPAEIRAMLPHELINALLDETKDPRILQQIQIHLGIAQHALSIENDPYVNGAKRLSTDLGHKLLIESKAIQGERREMCVFIDELGNAIEKKEGAEFVTIELIQVAPKLEVYFPGTDCIDDKKESSVISKMIREPHRRPKDIFDLWRWKTMVNYTSEEIENDPEIADRIKEFAIQTMEGLGFRHAEGKKREDLKPGEFTFTYRKKSAKRVYFPGGKVYLRTHGTDETPAGIGCEWQLIPQDIYLKTKSEDHPSHPKFFEAKKTVYMVASMYPKSLFPRLHETADFIAKGLNDIIQQNGIDLEDSSLTAQTALPFEGAEDQPAS